jgi:hypothetical protein
MNQWTLTVEEDPDTGDAILTFPPELLEQAEWKEGDRGDRGGELRGE